MKIVHSNDPKEGEQALVDKIISLLNDRKKVLWLICGGSNIPTAIEVMARMRAQVSGNILGNLTVSQTDERYGPVGPKDSNWQQMVEGGFNFQGIKSLPILENITLEETIVSFGRKISEAFADVDFVVGQLGIGPDGHIAGILPNTPAVNDTGVVTGYVAEPFTRVSLTFNQLTKINFSYVFAFGASKRQALTELRDKDLSLNDQPCAILKQMKESSVFTDQV